MWQLKVNGQLVECVDEFCYLGSIITNTLAAVTKKSKYVSAKQIQPSRD